MTMPLKFSTLRKGLPELQGQEKFIELSRNRSIGTFLGEAGSSGQRSGPDPGHRYHPPTREMLELDGYEVALVSRSRGGNPQIAEREAGSSVPPVPLMTMSWDELVARVSEAVRPPIEPVERRVAQFGNICVDFRRMEVRRLSGQLITLTHQEFKALKCFLSNPGRAFSRDELLNEAWGYESYPLSRTVDNHVLRLRQKLEEDPANPIHFLTVRSIGYKFVP